LHPRARLESVSKTLGSRPAVCDLSLEIASGERVAMLGPSGCGKTTLLRLIAGFLAPDRGTVELNGGLVSSSGRIHLPPERRGVGMVFQDLALWPHLTVLGNLRFGLAARRVNRTVAEERIRRILQTVGLANRAGDRPGSLSGGEQQRVALARALVLEPSLLLMDEPLSNLDHELSKHLRGEILRLHAQFGFSLLYVTHSREEAAEIGSRVLVMEAGRISVQAS
jgi:ABC-type Fe3+/spermidine/putrescine transport system ATPase subunit